jgi:mono/diheme cytochrome c family protein
VPGISREFRVIRGGTNVARTDSEPDNGPSEMERKVRVMKTINFGILGTILAVVLYAAATLSVTAVTASSASQDQFDAAATYKAKCVACHGAKSEKKFDATKADAVHLEAILKGRKMEKPPNMPSYEEKGITEDQAKALLAHMKSIQ